MVTLLTSGCFLTDSRFCTGEFVYGVSVEAMDSTTSEPVTEGLTGTLVDAGHTEVMEVIGNRLVGAGERPGNYSITVSALGYEAWNRSGIEVHSGDCHVTTVHMQARLTPSG